MLIGIWTFSWIKISWRWVCRDEGKVSYRLKMVVRPQNNRITSMCVTEKHRHYCLLHLLQIAGTNSPLISKPLSVIFALGQTFSSSIFSVPFCFILFRLFSVPHFALFLYFPVSLFQAVITSLINSTCWHWSGLVSHSHTYMHTPRSRLSLSLSLSFFSSCTQLLPARTIKYPSKWKQRP